MKTWGLWIAALMILSGALAKADVDVVCKNSDCLRAGWMTYDTRTGFNSDLSCINGDCTQFGWQVFSPQGSYRAECLPGGCFAEGWTEVYPMGQQLTYTCGLDPETSAGDCFHFGWSNRPRAITATCLGNSCRNDGWTLSDPGYPAARVICKAAYDDDAGETVSDCFRFGWNGYP